MYRLITLFNKEWLEDKLMFSFRSKKAAPPPPPPEKSQAEKDADANRDRELRAEQYNARKTQVAGKRRRRGRSLLMYAKSGEAGVSDTLG
tara:strand:+ start:129 stop:398 length:270 start_codon:yes stop_codon:yes gene_type:complete